MSKPNEYVKLKYKPEDYPSMADYLEEAEKVYNDYVKNKTITTKGYLTNAIFNVKLGIKNMVVMEEISEEEAEEMMNYYWGVLYDD